MITVDDLKTQAQLVAVAANDLLASVTRYGQSLLANDPGQPAEIKLLPVPWVGQNVGQDDDLSSSDCGPACCAMVLRYLGQNVTVNQASKAANKLKGYKGTAYWDLTRILLNWKVAAGRVVPVTIDTLRREIDAGKPVILLVHYGSLPTRSDLNFTGGHWIVVVGRGPGGLYYHDPYWRDDRGARILISDTDLERAMDDCKLDENKPRQGIFLAAVG